MLTMSYKLKMEQAKRNKNKGLDAFDSFLINSAKLGMITLLALFLATPNMKHRDTQRYSVGRCKP